MARERADGKRTTPSGDFIYPAEDEIDVDSLSVADLIDYSEGSGKLVYVIHAIPI